jgi:hypothetical protein
MAKAPTSFLTKFANNLYKGKLIILWYELQAYLRIPLTQDEVYLIHYVIKFVSDLLHVDGFLQVLRFPPPIKLTATI